MLSCALVKTAFNPPTRRARFRQAERELRVGKQSGVPVVPDDVGHLYPSLQWGEQHTEARASILDDLHRHLPRLVNVALSCFCRLFEGFFRRVRPCINKAMKENTHNFKFHTSRRRIDGSSASVVDRKNKNPNHDGRLGLSQPT